MHAKNCLGRKALAQEASQTFSCNTSVQQNTISSASQPACLTAW